MYVPTIADRVLGSPQLRRRQLLGRTIGRTLAHMHVEGIENVPDSGPVVIAMNHRSFIDGPLVFGFTARPVTCLVKIEAFTPRWGPVLRSAGQVPVDRDRIDVAPVRQCLQILYGGGVVGVFPEAARGDGLVTHAKPGAAYLALRAGATIVPVAFHGTEHLAQGPHRPDVSVVVGTPIAVDKVDPYKPLNKRVVAEESERLRVVLAEHVRATADTHPRAQS